MHFEVILKYEFAFLKKNTGDCQFNRVIFNDLSCMIIETAMGDTFSQVYDYINNLESSSYQSSTEKSEFLSDIGFFGVIAYFTGLFFVYTQRKLGKLILSIGLFLFIFELLYDSAFELIFYDYAPSLIFRYLWFFTSGSLITILYLEDFGLLKKSPDEISNESI